MLVNFNKVGYKDEPFILASQAQLIFYATNHVYVNWSIVLLTNKINDHHNEDIEDEDTNIKDDPLYDISYDDDPITNDILYMRDDHDEGIWINPSFCVNKKPKQLKLTRKKKRLAYTCLFFLSNVAFITFYLFVFPFLLMLTFFCESLLL